MGSVRPSYQHGLSLGLPSPIVGSHGLGFCSAEFRASQRLAPADVIRNKFTFTVRPDESVSDENMLNSAVSFDEHE